MNKLDAKIAKFNAEVMKSYDWRYELYFLIKDILKVLCKQNKFDESKLDKNLKYIHENSIQVISDSRKKYLILKKDKLKTKHEKLKFLINENIDESFYELNKKVTSPLLIEIFILPLLEKLYLRDRNKHLEREKNLLNRELDKENADNKRKQKKKCEEYINEVLQVGDIKLSKVDLAKQIKKRIKNKYPSINFSVNTIRPKLSSIDLP